METSSLPQELRRLVCAFDFTPYSREGLQMAVTLARAFGAELHVLHVIVTPPAHLMAQGDYVQGILEEEHRVADRLGKELRPEMEAAVESAGGAGLPVTCAVREGLHEDLVIREYAELVGAGLIVMASHGRRGLARFFLGSTSERVLRAAPCPVLIVRPREARRRDRLTDPDAGA